MSEPSLLLANLSKWRAWVNLLLLSRPLKIPLVLDFTIFFSHLYFFLQWVEFTLFSCLLLLVCLIFSIMGYYYVPLKSENIQEPAAKKIPHIQENTINLETKNTKL